MHKLLSFQLLILLSLILPACTTTFTSGDELDEALYLTVKDSHFFNTNESLKKIDELLLQGANPNGIIRITSRKKKESDYQDHWSTPFLLALAKDNPPIIKKLSDAGGISPIPVGKPSQEEMDKAVEILDSLNTVLYSTILQDTGTIVVAKIDKLVRRGANPKAIVLRDIHNLIKGANLPLVKRFVKNKYNKSKEYTNMLHAAVYSNNKNAAQKLIDLGAEINTKDIESALIYAVRTNNLPMIKLFVENGADINVKNNKNETPLAVAVKYNYLPIVKYLIAHGANTQILIYDNSLIEYTEEKGFSEMNEYFKSL